MYELMIGYKTTICEMHDIPGGLCTAWKRKGYTFDISIHMLFGSNSGPLNKMWQELGVLKDRKFFYHNVTARIQGNEKRLDICYDPQRLEDQMLALSTADASLIKEFVRLLFAKSITNFVSLKPLEIFNLIDNIKMHYAFFPFIGVIRKYGHLTIQEFAKRF